MPFTESDLMDRPADVAVELRRRAARARRLSHELTKDEAADLLSDLADELDARAARLEAERACEDAH